MKKQMFVGLLLFCSLSYPARFSFAITGNQWNDISKEAQDFYVIGVVDAWNGALSVCKEISNADCYYSKIRADPLSCFTESPYRQVIAIVQKYMKESPAIWHFTMESNIWNALHQTCKAGKTQ